MNDSLALPALLQTLRAAGLRLGVAEMARLQRVFALEPFSGADDAARKLRALVRAVVVKSRAERDTFDGVWQAWETQTAGAYTALETTARDWNRPTVRPRQPSAERRHNRLVALLIAVFWAAIMLRTYVIRPPESVETYRSGPGIQQDVSAAQVIGTFNAPVPQLQTTQVEIWQGWLPLALCFLAFASGGGLWWQLSRRSLLPEPPQEVIERGPPRLILSAPTGAVPRLLSGDEQDALVWGIGRFVTDQPTPRLDLPATVRATARAAGVAHLRFQHAVQHREVWLWIDTATRDPALLQLVEEIETSLALHGLPVERATFRGVPHRLTRPDGEVFAPREIEERRGAATVAILTDGRTLCRHLATDHHRVATEALLRDLARWPRLLFVDFSAEREALRGHLGNHELETVAPEALAYRLGEISTHRLRHAPHADSVWAAACALLPTQIPQALALELRNHLGLTTSGWAWHTLYASAPGPPGQLRWTPQRRADLLNWLPLVEGETEGATEVNTSLLHQALEFWLQKLSTQAAACEVEDSDWQHTPAGRQHRLHHSLLTLWHQPANAAHALYRLYNSELRDAVRQQLSLLTSVEGGAERIRLPWRWASLEPLVQAMLAEMGFGDRRPAEDVERPGRHWLAVALCGGLGVGALLAASGRPAVPEAKKVLATRMCEMTEFTDGWAMEFVELCPGTFMMGSPEAEEGRDTLETLHQVTLSRAFSMGKYEVTNRQYKRQHPDHPQDDNLPVVNVSWIDADSFCRAQGARLPTEAEWEYAARAGSQARWSFGDDQAKLDEYANTNLDLEPVGERLPNVWQLSDMHGNAWEWVADWYGPYGLQAQTDPSGPIDGSSRVLRGGSFFDEPRGLRSADRGRLAPVDRIGLVGFRCARGPRLELDS